MSSHFSMEWVLVKYLMLVLIVLLQIHGLKGCFEEERMGLLEFKAFLNSNGSHLLPSWVDDRESDCCGWEQVTCNATTRHVMDLSLNNTKQLSDEKLWMDYEDGKIWLLNVSLFQPFKELQSLNLSYNLFSGWIENEGFERLSILKKLETLNLYGNAFNNSILPSVSAITSLKTLSLGYNILEGSFPAQELATLENLEMLDLSDNRFNGTLTAKDLESLSRLKKVETLNLHWNQFEKSIVQSLSALPSLKNLNLAFNQFEGSFPTQELSVLENLETLDLSWNNLNGSLTMRDSKSLSKLSKLKQLDLSYNYFTNEILKEVATLSSLEVLILRGNYLNGTLPIQDLATFSNLEILDLSSNDFIGSIPPFIGALSSLTALSLSYNELNGSLPIKGLCELNKLQELDLSHNFFDGILPQCLNNMTSLQYIDLSHNSFKGSFSFSSFVNHSKLEVVKFISDNDKFEVEIELISSWVPMFQLKLLVLSNCNLRDIPKFLLNQYELREVDLSHNNLKGRFPNWLLENNTRLEFLSLKNNSFMGQFHLPPSPNINIYWMDVSDNQFSGQLQENIGEMVPNIIYLNLSRNTFEGSIPTSICEMSSLDELDLSNNKFFGVVPKQLVAGCIRLSVLKLSNNNFHGHIFSEHFNLTQITDLRLDNNQYIGTLSNVISKCSLLEVLDISDNYMSGEIPSWIGNMTRLATLVMRNNSFQGLFPCGLVPSVFLDLSHNSFSGSLPCCSNLQYLKHIHLRENKLSGSIPKAFLNSSNLLTLDIKDNFLSGDIPDLIGVLSNLRVLVLRGNRLSGLIPYQLCQLNKIGLMDLSENSLSGSIPHCFNNISFGKPGVSGHVFAQEYSAWRDGPTFYTYGSLLQSINNFEHIYAIYDEQEEVEFVTKYIPSAYKGDILNYMSGLDLSCNKLTGEIPHELGKLSWVRTLNLSHNQLIGSIPTAFSNLTQIESLDLSYNNLSGEIPLELIDLHFLEVFTVAHNNLSGKVPDRKGQFGTFENSSYDGNPFLCGSPLEKKCTTIVESPHSPTASSDESEGKWYEIDSVVFPASFATSYIMSFLGVATLLYINPYWRQRWFNLIEECFYTCYYFVSNTLYKLSACFHN